MKKFMSLFVSMLVFSAFAYGQKEVTNFAGIWNLEVEKSELGERSRIESMKMTVTQTDKELAFERKAEIEERSDGDGFGGGRRGMARGPGAMGGQAASYDLTGKETIAPGGRGGSAKLKAEMHGATVKLIQKREFEGPMGSVSIKSVETWSLSEDGKTLTVSSETETPRGIRNSKMVFTRAE
ncbi:MAG: hypothetical protein OEM82_10430 [Acidobacteriota bacterium]|nr:hypothetical protein [Acidobacteriota bacterium]MDH3529391.1 hypothetical protein [Acidobacteriota bacterium]